MAMRTFRSNSVNSYLSKDWRDPGDEWVKTGEGWEKIKIVQPARSADEPDIYSEEEKENEDPSTSAEQINPCPPELRQRLSSITESQPFCHITLKCTREIAGFNGLSEAMKRLDFRNAVWDQRRFHYVCKLLNLLITKKLATLTGGAQKMLFVMLEEVAHQVSTSQQNLHILHALIKDLQTRLEDYLTWGNKLGSKLLWKQHSERLDHINEIATTINLEPPSDDIHPNLQEVPEEVIREILLRLDNHRDLTSAGEAYSVMARVVSEQSIWRQLCRFHWDWQQIQYMIRTHKELQVKRDWELIYHKLRKSYGLKENYALNLELCKNCQCLFWESIGHPCLVEDNPDIMERLRETQSDPRDACKTIPPNVFLSYFSV